ncbi:MULTISPECIES: purple acid phosphatase family protein [unclassified Streptomyces]|uniref:purple acid phosphatase family protein n=1 Tax=unclassified Streptomyces TaxID=2593676 RepID=UPI002E189DE2|nr:MULTISPECIES: metallophosphoesterase family protein [unclassified Streptomyces]
MGVPEQLADRSLAEQHEYLRSKFSRRTMMRGGAVTLGAIAGGAFVPGAASAAVPTQTGRTPGQVPAAQKVDGALVAPFARHLAYGTDARTEMTVSWQVPVAVKNPYIRVGVHPWDLSRKIEAEVRPLYTPAGVGTGADHTQYYLHAQLTRLRPGTTYYYGVGHDGFDPAAAHLAGTLGTFRTAPSHREPFTFTAFGDQGVSYHALANDSLILAQNPAFHLHAGDIAYADPSGSGQTGDTFDARTWDQFLAQTESVAKQVPWMVAYGNHDMEAWYAPHGYGSQQARFTLPDNGPDAKNLPGVYSFVHGNTAVISLDANDVSWEIPANLGLSGGTQTSWFERRLKKFRADRDIDFIVVFFHHCAYCTATSHASEGGVRKEWVPLFEKYTVDLVINGHNHVYERTDVLKGDRVTKELPIGGTAYPETDGIVYVTAGAAGRSLYAFPVDDTYEGHEKEIDPFTSFVVQPDGSKKNITVDWSRVRYTNYSFLRVDVEPAPTGHTAKLTVRGLAETGEEIDRFVIARKVRRG